MPFSTWLKRKARELREERDFKKGVETEAHTAQKEAYRQSYRTRRLEEARRQGRQRAKPRSRGGLLDLLVGSGGQGKQKMPSFDLGVGLFGASQKKRVRHRRKR